MTTSVQIALEHTRTQDTYCVVFNSDATVFAVGTTRGLSVYSADPFVQLVERSVAGGVKLIAMHQQANVLALVPAERSSRILLWDDTRTSAPLRSSTASTATASPQSHATSSDESDVANAQAKLHVVARVDLDSAVAAVKLHKRCLVAASKCQVHLFDASLARVASFESDPAASRALAISTADHIGTFDVNFACAGPSTGTVLLVTYYDTHALKQYVNAQSKGSTSSSPPMGSSRVTSARGAAPAVPQAVKLGSGYHQTLAAPHSTTLANLAITADGSLALTASVQGTALKLIDVKSGVVMRQLNRGRLTNTIQSMAFNTNATLAAVVSETGTVHLFAVQPTNQVRATNPRSVFTRVAQTVGESMTASTYQRSHDDHPYAPYGDAASARAAVPAAHTASGSGRVQNYVSFAQGEFAFAKFDLTTCDDSPHGRRLFHGSLVGLRTGVDNQGRATLLIAQADWGRLLKIHVDVTERGEALLATSGNAAGVSSPEGANGPTQANRCALVSTWRFPSVPLL